ncbi:MAG: FapA family protein [Pseudomonadota bacterium]
MQGITLDFSNTENQLKMIVDVELCADILYDDARKAIQDSEYNKYKIYDGSLLNLIKSVKERIQKDAKGECEFVIGESLPTEIQISISEDEMEAHITLIGAYGGRTPRIEDFQQALALNGVVRGVSQKTINRLIEQASTLLPGEELTTLLAKGLPARKGKPTHMLAKIKTLTERALQPTESGKGKVDMRDFGEILSVTSGTVVAEIKPPSIGRDGYTVTHEIVPGIMGDHVDIVLGENTEKDEKDPDLIRATIDGQPKMVNGVMTIQCVLTLKGVNVRTGNIKYKGSVLVTGDVAEKMVIEAKGDVIVEGFVEAATIKSGGDIILSQGCSGPADKRDCILIAEGEVTLQHGQGVSIEAKGDIRVFRQIAYSTIDAYGKVFVGRGKRADGSIFACQVIARNTITAGNIGAVSNSKLEIDYSQGLQKYINKKEQLQTLRENLASINADHLIEYSKLNTRSNKTKAGDKLTELENALQSEQLLLQWLVNVENELAENLKNYKNNAQVIAMKNLYPNTTVLMGDNTLTTTKETKKNILFFQSEMWRQQPYTGG